MTEPAIAVSARDVRFSYGDRQALNGVSFEIPVGATHGFLGPNGSGKSTLFKLLATILPLQQGEVTVMTHDLRKQVGAIREKLGVVFQAPALDRKLTVRENLRYAGLLYGMSGADLTRRIDEMLEHGSLGDRAGERVDKLSGGLRRRVELAKGLMHRPTLVLLDEPSTGLDPGARQDLWRFLRAQEGVTVLFTTHLMDEAEHASRLIILNEGSAAGEGTPDELRSTIGNTVLEMRSDDPEAFAKQLHEALKVEVQTLPDGVRIQADDAHELVPDIMRRFGESVGRLTVGRPTLEDVFIARTGNRLHGDT